jgi:alkylhydroperoxidase family enzyme
MPKIPYLYAEDLPDEDKEVIFAPINIVRITAHSPNFTRALMDFGKYIRSGTKLPQRYLEMGIIAAAWEAQIEYEWIHHVGLALDAGAPEADIRALMAGSDIAEPAGSIVTLARQIATRGGADDDVFARVEAAIGREQLVDLVFIVSMYCGITRFLTTFGIEVEPEMEELLARFPLKPAS